MNIALGGYTISVIYDSPVRVGNEVVDGSYDPDTKTITIDADLPEAHRQETLFHEIVEAINDIYELDLEHPKISVLGVGLHQAVGPLLDHAVVKVTRP